MKKLDLEELERLLNEVLENEDYIKAIAIRDGRYYKLTWSRPTVSSPTRWLYQGKDFPMKAGQVWVALLDAQRTPKFTGTAS